jgi:regulator of PEP synthase PpsR (kinase-PPPase family)
MAMTTARYAGYLGFGIVLVGVSRVGKTPLAMYLAMNGYKTANVPLRAGADGPGVFKGVDAGRIIGLMRDAERLASYRKGTQREARTSRDRRLLGSSDDLYGARAGQGFFRKKGYAVIDVTDKPLETSATRS